MAILSAKTLGILAETPQVENKDWDQIWFLIMRIQGQYVYDLASFKIPTCFSHLQGAYSNAKVFFKP